MVAREAKRSRESTQLAERWPCPTYRAGWPSCRARLEEQRRADVQRHFIHIHVDGWGCDHVVVLDVDEVAFELAVAVGIACSQRGGESKLLIPLAGVEFAHVGVL